MDIDAVSKVMRDVAEDIIRPRFRTLAAGEISSKSGPNDLVTIADTEAEWAITPLLADIKDVPVVGEEATDQNPQLPQKLATSAAAWTVDPVDGTWNFAHGKPAYALMVGHVVNGEADTGWILMPETGDLLHAQVDGAVTVTNPGDSSTAAARAELGMEPASKLTRTIESVATAPARPLSQLRGMGVMEYAPADLAAGLAALTGDVGEVTAPRMCAGWDYWDLVAGDLDFLLYFRALPWDHAPGAAIARAAGYAVRHLDGTEYRPAEPGRPFMVARAQEWEALAEVVRAHAGPAYSA